MYRQQTIEEVKRSPAMPEFDVLVREATKHDVEAIVGFQSAMALETEGKALSIDTLRAGVRAVIEDSSKGYYLIAEVDGAPVGDLMVTYEWSDWRSMTFLWIQSVFVDAEWRRMGVYRAMHNHVVQTAERDPGLCGVRLYVDRDNHGAQRTYERLGMSQSHYDMYEIDFVL